MSAPSPAPFVHPTACVDDLSSLSAGCKVWHFSHVMAGAKIGAGTSLGQNVFVADDVVIGARVKVQNNVSLYSGVELEDDVFCGPSCVFTNVANPRSEIVQRPFARTLIKRGATIGANATIVCGTTIGQYALVGAGAVVTARVYPDYALLLGVPAMRRGWVGKHGRSLQIGDNKMYTCPYSGWSYLEQNGALICLEEPEERLLIGAVDGAP
jgi:UDP-2-acetamido-3-amino-2,3-dideoxy-glucuronate N-acetyltransferase